jgi:hypothetical protein
VAAKYRQPKNGEMAICENENRRRNERNVKYRKMKSVKYVEEISKKWRYESGTGIGENRKKWRPKAEKASIMKAKKIMGEIEKSEIMSEERKAAKTSGVKANNVAWHVSSQHQNQNQA